MRSFRANLLVASLLLLPVSMFGQAGAQPSVTNAMPTNDFGFNLPTHLGTLSYSLTGSELAQVGYGSVGATTVASGNLAYLSKSEYDPFSLVYSGGYLFSKFAGSKTSSTYQNVAASQVFRTRSWVYVVSDSLQYLPEAPTTGLSGIAGVGDIGVFPVQTGLGPTQSILTNGVSRLANGLEGSATWQMTPSLDLEGSASWDLLGFNNSSQFNSDQYGGTFGPNYRIDARNQIGAAVTYSRITYPNLTGYKIETYGANLNYSRAWTRRLSTSVSVGPQKTHGQTVSPIPGQINFAGTLSMTYATRTTGFYANYTRGVNAGSGIIYGSLSDLVIVGANRPLSRDWVFGLSGGYSHNTGLAKIEGAIPKFQDEYGGVQISRRISESLSAFGSYTGTHQSFVNESGNSNVFSGFDNTFAIGITFAPAPLIRGR